MPPEDSSIQVKCLPFQLRAYYVSEFSIRTNKRFDNKKEPDLKFNSLKFELDFEELDSEKGAQKSEHLKGFNLWEVRLNVWMRKKLKKIISLILFSLLFQGSFPSLKKILLQRTINCVLSVLMGLPFCMDL